MEGQGWLVLNRKIGQSILIGDVEVKVGGLKGTSVKLLICAPLSTKVARKELTGPANPK